MKILHPLKGNYRITGRFEKRTPMYINGVWTLPFHYGVDWGAPTGTPIYAVADGTVRTVSWDSSGYGGGWRIIINHSDGWSSHYLHMRSQSTLKNGQRVKAGGLVGYVGSTGLSTGAHLHFELQKNGVAVDPLLHITTSRKTITERDELMGYILVIKGHWYHVIPQGSAKPRAILLGGDSKAEESGLPIIRAGQAQFTLDDIGKSIVGVRKSHLKA